MAVCDGKGGGSKSGWILVKTRAKGTNKRTMQEENAGDAEVPPGAARGGVIPVEGRQWWH